MRLGPESVLLFGEEDLLPLLSTSRKEPGHDFSIVIRLPVFSCLVKRYFPRCLAFAFCTLSSRLRSFSSSFC